MVPTTVAKLTNNVVGIYNPIGEIMTSLLLKETLRQACCFSVIFLLMLCECMRRIGIICDHPN